jgi:catechol-2,3-dioxygenase
LGLTVSDLVAARDFFTDALAFSLVHEDPEYPSAFVSDGSIMLTLWQADEDARAFDRRAHVGLHHAAFLVESQSALEDVFATVSDWPGVEVECEMSPPRPNSPARHFLIRMPGGPRIEFFTHAQG